MSFHAYAVAMLSESHGWMEFNSSPTSMLSNYSNYCSTKHLRLEGYLTDMHLQTRWFVGCWQGLGRGAEGRGAGGHVKYTGWTDRVWIRSSLLWQQGLLLRDLLLLHPRHPGQQPAVAMATGTERTQTQTMWVSLLFRQAWVLLRFDLKKTSSQHWHRPLLASYEAIMALEFQWDEMKEVLLCAAIPHTHIVETCWVISLIERCTELK